MSWTEVCKLDDIIPDTGVAAKVGDQAVAIFRPARTDKLYALTAVDPFSGATVLARGMIGSVGETLTVASPIYKQRFALDSGACLDDETVTLPTYDVKVEDGAVLVSA